jgi:Family of unknown function (DUF6223)
MKKKNLLSGLITICSVCVLSVAAQPESVPTGITPGRAQALVGAAFGLVSAGLGVLALARAIGWIGRGTGKAGAIIALVLGLIGMVLSIVHLGTSTGGIGTGSGRLGAIVALVLSLIGVILGGLVLVRSRPPH